MTTTKRLPAALKKKLQASLESLSAKEAGRLYVIYAHEADRKGIDLDEYGPTIELRDAFNARVKRARGKPEERDAVNRYNGLFLLANIFNELNFDLGPGVLMAFALDAVQTQLKLFMLIQQDLTTETMRMIRSQFLEQPKPLEREDYSWLVQWSQGDALVDLSSAASFIDQEDVTEGAAEDKAAAYQAIYDALVEKLQAGDLVGGESVYDWTLELPILIHDGTIPAWAALRMTWQQYVKGRGLRIYDFADYADFAPDMVDRVGGANGDALDDEALRKLAAAFYKDCRRRPWGKGLVAKADPDDLVKLLTQSPNPLLHRHAPDLGRVDWATFQKSEVDRKGEPFETGFAATVESLNRLDPDFRRGVDFTSSYHQEHFYPVENPYFARLERARMFRMMSILDTTRQPFSFDRKEEGMMTISDLMGIKFLTPFEQKVADLRLQNDQTASLRHAIETISERYFGGLPILLQHTALWLSQAEEALKSGTETLNDWLDRLQGYPWEIDVSDLRLGEPEVDQDFANDIVDKFVKAARAETKIDDPESLLFDEGGRP